jgi:hypothetical protein
VPTHPVSTFQAARTLGKTPKPGAQAFRYETSFTNWRRMWGAGATHPGTPFGPVHPRRTGAAYPYEAERISPQYGEV